MPLSSDTPVAQFEHRSGLMGEQRDHRCSRTGGLDLIVPADRQYSDRF